LTVNVQHRKWAIFLALFIAALVLRLLFIHFLTRDLDGDSTIYMNLARNIAANHVYSIQDIPPYYLTFTRVPGYPLFIALVYSLFGHDNIAAIRYSQAFIDTLTCVVAGLLAATWQPDAGRKRKTALIAFVLAALCPFTIRYVPAILPETLSTFLALVLALTVSYALIAATAKRALWWWLVSGIIAGAATMVRPDSGLFAIAPGLLLAGLLIIGKKGGQQNEMSWDRANRLRTLACGAVLTVGFALAMSPWIIRNWIVFQTFQPLQPHHQGLPDGFLADGYYKWLRTWVDDQRYIKPFRWEMYYSPIMLDQLPDKAFDSAEERQRVGDLLLQYNQPKYFPGIERPLYKMTRETDEGFAQIARERIERSPARFYLWLPAKRAFAIWFDTHSDHYPFWGEVFSDPRHHYFPADANNTIQRRLMLWLFAALVWGYTLLGVLGGWTLWSAEKHSMARVGLVFAVLLMLPRVLFFSTIDNPEPRFLVQLFPFLAVLGGIALSRYQVERHLSIQNRER